MNNLLAYHAAGSITVHHDASTCGNAINIRRWFNNGETTRVQTQREHPNSGTFEESANYPIYKNWKTRGEISFWPSPKSLGEIRDQRGNAVSFEAFALAKIQQRHPNVLRRGFRDAIREINDLDETILFAFIPDVYEIDFPNRILTLYEIEDSCKLTKKKMNDIRLFAHNVFDCYDFITRLVITDRYGAVETQIWSVEDEIT